MTTTAINAALPALRRDRLSHAYILVSPEQHKVELSQRLAALMLCQSAEGDSPCGRCADCRKIFAGIHPDCLVIKRPLDDKGKPRREVYVAQIRALTADSVILPNEAAFKVYCILDAQYMNTQAQNALLKLLEEPPKHLRFILCAENAGSLLGTIRSRCIELGAVFNRTDGGYTDDEMKYLSLAEKGDKLELLRFCLALETLTAMQLQEYLQRVGLYIGCVLSGREGPSSLERVRLLQLHTLLARCCDYLRSNVGVKQVLGLLAARTIDLE